MFADNGGILGVSLTLLDNDGILICLVRFLFADDVTIILTDIMFERNGRFGLTFVISDADDDFLLILTDLSVRSGLSIGDVVVAQQFSFKRLGCLCGMSQEEILNLTRKLILKMYKKTQKRTFVFCS